MNQTFENIKYILREDMGFNTTIVEPKEDENILLVVGLNFTKTNLQMLHITEIEYDTVIINFNDIRYKNTEKVNSEDVDFEKYAISIAKINNKLKYGKFIVDFDEESQKYKLNYRMSLIFEDELSKKIYKKVLYTSLKIISDHAIKVLEG